MRRKNVPNKLRIYAFSSMNMLLNLKLQYFYIPYTVDGWGRRVASRNIW